MQNDSESLLSIILASQDRLVKMLITLEPHGIFITLCILIHYNIIKKQVSKTVIRLCQDFYVAEPSYHFAYLCHDNV